MAAASSVEVLHKAFQAPADKKTDRNLLENRHLETQGLLLCQQGEAKAGLTLLAKLRERTKNVHRQMGWAHGAYFDEVHLLKLREFRSLFPDAALSIERFAGFPKSYTLIRRYQ